MDLRQERTIELDASPAQVAGRLQTWAQASGFICTNKAPRRWVFARGSTAQALWTFDIRKVPTEAEVEIVSDAPAMVRFSMHVKSGLQVQTGGDAKRVSEQMDLLAAHLQGAL